MARWRPLPGDLPRSSWHRYRNGRALPPWEAEGVGLGRLGGGTGLEGAQGPEDGGRGRDGGRTGDSGGGASRDRKHRWATGLPGGVRRLSRRTIGAAVAVCGLLAVLLLLLLVRPWSDDVRPERAAGSARRLTRLAMGSAPLWVGVHGRANPASEVQPGVPGRMGGSGSGGRHRTVAGGRGGRHAADRGPRREPHRDGGGRPAMTALDESDRIPPQRRTGSRTRPENPQRLPAHRLLVSPAIRARPRWDAIRASWS